MKEEELQETGNQILERTKEIPKVMVKRIA